MRRWLLIGAIVGGILTASWLVLAVLLIVAWTIGVYFWPFTQCRRCSGRKTNPGSTPKRYGLCRKCGGNGSRQVLGAKAVRRTARAGREGFRTWREKQ